MRTIKFRGKSIESSEWVEGDLITDPKTGVANCILVLNGNPRNMIEVDANTVGQLTGLQDKNKKEIYEGDILKIKCLGWEYARVVFHYGVFGFYVIENSRLCAHVPQYWEDGEIIGNIHDNPELIPVY